MFPGGTGGISNWAFFEYNTLTRNALINWIVRVNIDPSKAQDFSNQQTLWSSGDPPFGSSATTDADTTPLWPNAPANQPAGGAEPEDGI
jgi:hypothetical protein